MNSRGERSQEVAPWATSARSPPIRPMSWYSGNQETTRSSAVRRSARAIASTLAARLAAVMTTPRGVPVLPDVYWIRAGSSPVAGSGSGPTAGSRVRGSISGREGWRRPESRRYAAVLLSANTAEGAASCTTLVSRFTNAAGRANPSSEGSGTGTAPMIEAPRKQSRNARPVGTQSRTRSVLPRPLRLRAAAQVPAPRTHSPMVTPSSRNAPRAALRKRWTAMRSGSLVARARSRAVMDSGIADQSSDQTTPETPAEPGSGEPASLELIRHERAVPMQDAEPFQRVPAHAPRRQAQLAPDRFCEQRSDAGPHALEHQVLHLRHHPSGEDLRERSAQLVAVGQVPGLVFQVDAQHRGQQRLARLGQEGGHQRGGRPLEHHLPDEQLHLRRCAVLDGLEGRSKREAGRVDHACFLREVPLQREEVLGFLLRHDGEELPVRRPFLRRQHHDLRDQVLAAALPREKVGKVETGFAEDEGAALPDAHGPEGTQAPGEEALVRKHVPLRIHLQVPGQILEGPGLAQGGLDQRMDAAHGFPACSETATVVPRPGSLSTRTVPCWAATSSCTMERPSPVPEPGGLVVKKGSKILLRFSLGMPQPLSMTESSTRSPVRDAAMRTSPPWGFTACTALWMMFRITWKRSCGFARTTSPSICWTIETPLGVWGATIFTTSGTTSESLTETEVSPLCLRPKSKSWRVTAVIRSRLWSMSVSSGAAPSIAAIRLRSSARFPRRKCSGLFISCATPAIIRPSATIFSLCTSDASAFLSWSSASRSCRACARSPRCSSMRARSSCKSNGLWT